MSGHKRATITISQDEYRRLHDAEMKLRFMPAQSPDTSMVVAHQVNHALQEHLDQLEERQRRFERAVRGFQKEVQEAELETARAHAREQAVLYERLAGAQRTIENTQALIERQAADFSARLEEEHRARQDEVMRLESLLDGVLDEQERKFAMARQWLEQAVELRRFIEQQYAHDSYTPGEAAHLDGAIDLAIANLDAGMPEAALLGAQQAYAGLSDLRVRLEQMDSEWRLLLESCWENAARLLAFAEENRTCLAHDLDGNELPYPIEVDFWTGGEFSRQIDALAELVRQLQDCGDSFDLPSLRQLAAEELSAWYEVLSETIYQARLAVLNSQLRINMADLVVQALQEQGFFLAESDYANGDQRMAYSAKVRSLGGNEIVVQVAPDPNIVGKNELHLISLDRAQHTEHELRKRSEEVASSLIRRGLDVADVRENGGRHPGGSPGHPSRRRGQAGRQQYHRISQSRTAGNAD